MLALLLLPCTTVAAPSTAPLAKRLKDVLDTLLQKVGEQLPPEELLSLVSL